MTEIEKDFYSNLGVLSVKFAKMEHNLMIILSLLITQDTHAFLGMTLVEKNSLHKNIELLMKMVKIKSYGREEIEQMIKDVNKIRKNRNLFIHGIWSHPYESEGKIKIVCDEKRISYEEDERGQHWKGNTIHKFTLEDIQEEITELNQIIEFQDNYIKQLSEYLLEGGRIDW